MLIFLGLGSIYAVVMGLEQQLYLPRNLRLFHFVPLLMLSMGYLDLYFAQFLQSDKVCLQ